MAIVRFFQRIFEKDPAEIIADRVLKSIILQYHTTAIDDDELFIQNYSSKRDSLATFLRQCNLAPAFITATKEDQLRCIELISSSILKNNTLHSTNTQNYPGISRVWALGFYSYLVPDVLFTVEELNKSSKYVVSTLTALMHLRKILLDTAQTTLLHRMPRELNDLVRNHLYLEALYSSQLQLLESTTEHRPRSHTC